jgi:hypothetical protein
MTLSRQTVIATGVAAAVLTALALAVANFVGGGEGGAGPYAITLVGSLVLAGILFGWAIPRTTHPARAGIVAGAFGLLSVAVTWTGVPFVLGPAAIVYGLLGRARPTSRGAATVAVVLGTLATVGAIAFLVGDQLA